jgi:hypothetical protein
MDEFGNMAFERAILFTPDDPFYHNQYLLPNDLVPDSDPYPLTKTFQEELDSTFFKALLVWFLLGAGIVIFSMVTNINIINHELNKGGHINIVWFIILSVLMAVLGAHMSFRPYLVDRNNKSSVMLYAIILYVVFQILWGLALFHRDLNEGSAGIFGLAFISATVWLVWVCYHFFKDSIFIGILLILWSVFIQDYTIRVTNKLTPLI